MTVLIILIAILAAVLVISFGIYWAVFHSPDRRQNIDRNIPRLPELKARGADTQKFIVRFEKVPFETVYTTSSDGLRLRGRLYMTAEDAPFVIGFHGYRGTPMRDLSAGVYTYFDCGCNVLLIEHRAHCGSEGHTITYGVKERYDCLRWIEFVRERFGEDRPVVLAGISMGAATVLMASGLDLPSNVRGIIADAPFTSPEAIIHTVCSSIHLPYFVVGPFIRLAARLYAGIGLRDADAAEAVKRTPVPILLIHGEADGFVPCEMGRQIAAANPEMIELHTFPDAGHGLSFLVDQPRYERLVRDFLSRVLGPAEENP